MILEMVCVRDFKTEVFGRPFFMTTVGSAIRSFDDEVNRAAEDNSMYRHPEDFALYHIGTYNDEDAQTVSFAVPKLLVTADQVKKGMLQSGITAV